MRKLSTLEWDGRSLELLDQTRLPADTVYLSIDTAKGVWEAINTMQVRGAPAIGVTAAYGMVLAARGIKETSFKPFLRQLKKQGNMLASARPTAVNLPWAVGRMLDAARIYGKMEGILQRLETEAVTIHKEDMFTNRRIGEFALGFLKDGYGVLTHCNAGMLATTKYGTGLAAFYLAKERGINIKVYVDETRPRFQGASLTAYELLHSGIDVTLICDSTAAVLMAQGKINAVLTGCDRVAANGDIANKIGTFGLSIAAKHFGIPVYVAAPVSTIDLGCESGAQIPIEERSGDEITIIGDVRVAPEGVKTYNPAFDITPAENITAIITEHGAAFPPFEEGLKALF
ncbi:MAG: S-methyl-5-thioribose-1-phosphate isomerase [Christensenellales bacterium]